MFLATRSLAVTDICTARSTLVQKISNSCIRDHALRHTRPLRLDRAFSSFSSSSSHSSSRISYRVAGSCSAKGRRFHPEKHTYNFEPTLHDAIGVSLDNISEEQGLSRKNRPASGEDAFFASRIGTVDTGAVAFAVADGVGGWAEHKIDPADVSHGLCTYMAQHALTEELSRGKLRPKELLQKGYESVVADESITAGGTTASVGVALTDGSVELANLGDSGSVLFRLGAVHQYSAPQTHAFNTPYQLNIIPQRMRDQAHMFGGVYFEDSPRDAAVSTLSMQHGDVLILATDGVFDNLNNQDILKIVTGRMLATGAWTEDPKNAAICPSTKLHALSQAGGLHRFSSKSSSSPSSSSSSSSSSSQLPPPPAPHFKNHHTLQALIAASIVGEAKLASVDMRRDGPFAKEAQRYYPGHWYRGGKVDDISVLVIIGIEKTD
ncbi:conserved hypothetical protein [Talaromyces stipitatus ATCC 10500]|uniref:Protein phosphatase n=1 Tax=Talaromyces stipitatus (strain ATCC 10500 / CBS 375.48 / QM 6759 / NRRL 1006) TaxID=441959 RepID=B8MF44_TALSN|nr:uncharacterized protein TSTA_012510 [Talaromyces stipitatus ATCC 10500]EED16143.1 conserved hypothetical protein [Talaromyces stipitatus ATCC 10500]